MIQSSQCQGRRRRPEALGLILKKWMAISAASVFHAVILITYVVASEFFATEREGVWLALPLEEPMGEPGRDAKQPKPRTQTQARSIGLEIEKTEDSKTDIKLLRHSWSPTGFGKISEQQNMYLSV